MGDRLVGRLREVGLGRFDGGEVVADRRRPRGSPGARCGSGPASPAARRGRPCGRSRGRPPAARRAGSISVTGSSMRTMSTYWCDSLWSLSRPVWPVMATIGAWSRIGVGDPGHEVGRARPEGRHRDRGTAGQPSVDVGHEGGALFVAGGDVADDRLAAERVEDVHRLLARDREDVLTGLRREAVDEQRGGRPVSGRGHPASLREGRSDSRHTAVDDRAGLRRSSCGWPRSRPIRPAATRRGSGSAAPCRPMRRCSGSRPRSATRRRPSLAPDGSGAAGRFRVRYFSPLAEVPFCGHATIAAGVALAERGLVANGGPADPASRDDDQRRTDDGAASTPGEDGLVRATLTSIATTGSRRPTRRSWPARSACSAGSADDLDPDLPPAVGFAGARHLILVARRIDRLATLDYPFEALKALMLDDDLTTIQLVCREGPGRFRARDPFPVGGVVEDPATGAAAAAFGAYLRERGEIVAPAAFEIVQGVEMGRPSRITVSIAPGEAGVRVSGNAVQIDRSAPSAVSRMTRADRRVSACRSASISARNPASSARPRADPAVKFGGTAAGRLAASSAVVAWVAARGCWPGCWRGRR